MAVELDEIHEGGPRPCVRVTTFEGSPEVVERALQLTLDHVVPAMRDKPGWQGLIGLVTLDGRRGLTLSFWESEDAFIENAGSQGDIRNRAAAAGLTFTGAERLRVVFSEEQ